MSLKGLVARDLRPNASLKPQGELPADPADQLQPREAGVRRGVEWPHT